MPKLTKTFVDGAAPGRHYDSELAGFGLWVGRTGRKSYFIEYRTGYGRGHAKRRMVIGRHGVLTPQQARREAVRLLGMVRAGSDPLALRRAPGGPSVASVASQWLAEIAAKRKPRTVRDYRRLMDLHVLPELGAVAVATVDRQQVARLHTGMSRTPSEANHMLRALSAFFGWCERRGWRPDGSNPVRHVERYREGKRERYLSGREMQRLSRALLAAGRMMPPWPVAAIRLLLFTGCRMSEVLTLRWEHADLEAACLRLPSSKTGPKIVHLNAPARQVLSELPRVHGSPWVICGQRGRHLADLERPWRRIRKAALLPDVRLHDLRHSFASFAIAGGVPLSTISRLLGHTAVAMTERYAHLADDPVKAAAEAVGRRIEDAMRRRNSN